MESISFKRLLEIDSGSEMTPEEVFILNTHNVVYAIYNNKLNKIYIGETVDTYIRLFSFWKKDKRHVSGKNSPLIKLFGGDTENTYFRILENDCNNQEREFYWDKYYRETTDYIIISHPGRHGCTNPGNKGLIAIHKGNLQTYINPLDLDVFLAQGWCKGGKSQGPRTKEQRETISKSHKGRTPWNKGLKLSEDQKNSYKKLGRKSKPVKTIGEKLEEYYEVVKLINEGNYSLRTIAKLSKVSLTTVRRIKQLLIK